MIPVIYKIYNYVWNLRLIQMYSFCILGTETYSNDFISDSDKIRNEQKNNKDYRNSKEKIIITLQKEHVNFNFVVKYGSNSTKLKGKEPYIIH